MPTTTTANKPDLTGRLEGVALVAILVLVALAAGWASFSHVHDWTMRHVPANTPDMFGWVNAVISELVPVAALLTIRRRKRHGAPIGYPMFLLIAAATLSLSAQLAVADASPSGWLLSAVPALAFMALVKLVLAPVTTTNTDTATAELVDEPDDIPTVTDAPTAGDIPAVTQAADPATVPTHLLPTARFAAVQHEQSTGRPITVDELAARLSIAPATAGSLLATINPPAHHNGSAVVLDGAR